MPALVSLQFSLTKKELFARNLQWLVTQNILLAILFEVFVERDYFKFVAAPYMEMPTRNGKNAKSASATGKHHRDSPLEQVHLLFLVRCCILEVLPDFTL